jgi:hypothetical protein
MDIHGLLTACRAYRAMGDAVVEQIDHVFNGTMDEANPNALRMIRDFLQKAAWQTDGDLHDELKAAAEEIQDYLQKP